MTNKHPSLHPLNQTPVDMQAPGWEPQPYPKASPFASVEPGSPEEAELKRLHLMNEWTKLEVARLYPTLGAFMRHVYDRFVAKQAFEACLRPKHIVPPGGYMNTEAVPGAIYTTLYEVASKWREERPIMPTEVTAALVLFQVLNNKAPIYYVSEELCRAVAATELPKDFTLQDLHLPVRGMVFGFPERFTRELLGRNIGYVMAAEFEHGSYSSPAVLEGTPLWIPAPIQCPAKFAWQFHTYDQGTVGSYVSSYWKAHALEQALVTYGYTDYTLADEGAVARDADMSMKLSSLIFKLLVVLQVRPNLITHGVCLRKGKPAKHGRGRSELWSATTIGATYLAPRRQAAEGTHASPRWHWRRGHLTHQVVGQRDQNFVSVQALPRRSDGEVDWLQVPDETRAAFWRCHKRVWLEPFLVNFDADAKETSAGSAPAK